MTRATWICFAMVFLLMGSLAGRAIAQEPSADELSKATQNPVSSLISVPLQTNFDTGVGTRESPSTTMNFQPVMPFALAPNWNGILRTIIPLVSVPGPDSSTRINGLGDSVVTLFLSPSQPGALIWGVGPVMLLPTATNPAIGTEKVGIGPSVVVLTQTGPWTVGALMNQIWSVDGANDRSDVNQMLLQPFVNFNLGEGAALGLQSEASANWEADNEWTIPIELTLSKVTKMGKRPVSFLAGLGDFVTKPAGSADWRFRFQMTFLFPR